MVTEHAAVPSKNRIFLSWSGTHSHQVAITLQEWLTAIFPSLQVFLSSKSIEKGEKWPDRLALALSEFDLGVVIVNEQNKDAPWLLFEAGALSKDLRESRVIPLLCSISLGDLEGSPLSYFQAVVLSKGGLLELMSLVNSKVGAKISDSKLQETFDVWWERRGQPICDVAAKIPGKAPVKREPTISDVLARMDRLEHGISRVATKVTDLEVAAKIQSLSATSFLESLTSPPPTGFNSAAALMGVPVTSSPPMAAVTAADLLSRGILTSSDPTSLSALDFSLDILKTEEEKSD